MIIFARPRWEYDSYKDLFELIRLSEFPLVFFDEIDWQSENTYIISPNNGEIPNPLPEGIRCKMIWLNIERPSWQNSWKFDRHDFDEIWVCDKNWAKNVGARYFLMGSHPDLGEYSEEKEYDVLISSYDNPRRTAMWAQLEGLKLSPNGWEDRRFRKSHSRIQVIPQQDNPPHAVTPLRFATAAAYRLPLVYEAETDTYPFVDGVHFIHADYENMAAKAREALENPEIQKIGDQLFDLLCVQTNFRKEVERMFE